MTEIINIDAYDYLHDIKTNYEGDYNIFKSLSHGQTTQQDGNPRNPIDFGLTIPFTLATFSIIDRVGYLIGEHGNFKKTDKNFRSFFKEELEEKEINFLNYMFRQGLVHSYFPKAFLKIGYQKDNFSNKLFIIDPNYSDLDNVNCLNVKHLISLVIKILNNVIDNRINDNYIHKKLKKILKCESKDYNKNKI